MKIIVTEAQIKQYINELFSQKLVQQLIDKFQQENPDLAEDTINAYIDRFQQIKDSPKVQEKDISQYSWDDLETLIINNQPQYNTKNINRQEDTVYNDNELEILLGNSKDSCIKYGDGYTFCISARGERNAFNDYRLDNTIYFVIDHERSKEKDENDDFIDPYHIIVVMKSLFFDDGFTLTDANNRIISLPRNEDGIRDREPAESLEDLLWIQPKLKGKEKYLKWREAEQKTVLIQHYENELRTLSHEYAEILGPKNPSYERPLHFIELTKNSWELVNSIFNKGKRYILYKDDVPKYGEIKIDDEPKDEWFERSKHKVPQLMKGGHDVGTHAVVTDFNDYPEDYKEYVARAKQLMKQYYRKLSTLK